MNYYFNHRPMKFFKQILLLILLLFACESSFCQMQKLFTKVTNHWYEMDFKGNRTGRINYDEGQKFEFYFDKSKSYGYIMVTEYYNNNKWKMELKTMYTRMVNGAKVYFFQSSDDGFKISTQIGFNGVCLCSYSENKCTNYYQE